MLRYAATRLVRTFNVKAVPNGASSCGLSSKRFSSSDSSEADDRRSLENVDTFKCLNRVTLLGRATGPATSYKINNTDVVSFTLATNEIRRNKADELIKRSEFHRVQVFIPRLVNKTKVVVDKGARIFVEGKINYNVRRDESGNTTHFTNIIAENIVFITGNRQGQIEQEEEEIIDEVKQ